jgi:cytochrome c oxidase subunit IV
MVMTGITVWVAFLDLRFMNTVVALSIAVFKATLVVLYFMHVRYATRLTWVVAASGFIWMLILFALTMSDYLSRGWVNIAQ